jgi:methionine sulfoxide reductase heme-binding subunit
MTQRWVVLTKAALWAACLAPLALLVLQGLGDTFPGTAFQRFGSLGVNPVERLLDVCGTTGLNLLMLTLCISPLRRSLGINRLVSFRRLLGLFSFFYIVLHFSTYALLDLGLLFQPQFAWSTLLVDVVERPYITVGFTALVLLIPLAVTSTRALQRRLGRNWVKLHRLVYVIAILGVLHFWWQKKSDADFAEPLLYGVLLAALLGERIKHRLVHSKAAMAASYRSVQPPQPGEKASH